MNLEALQEQLEIDEGVKYEIYLDHLGLPTCGIGHLILDSDPEYGEPVGTPVSEERVTELFQKDCEIVLKDCQILYPDLDSRRHTVHLDCTYVQYIHCEILV